MLSLEKELSHKIADGTLVDLSAGFSDFIKTLGNIDIKFICTNAVYSKFKDLNIVDSEENNIRHMITELLIILQSELPKQKGKVQFEKTCVFKWLNTHSIDLKFVKTRADECGPCIVIMFPNEE